MRFISIGTLVKHYYAVASLSTTRCRITGYEAPEHRFYTRYIHRYVYKSCYPINRKADITYGT